MEGSISFIQMRRFCIKGCVSYDCTLAQARVFRIVRLSYESESDFCDTFMNTFALGRSVQVLCVDFSVLALYNKDMYFLSTELVAFTISNLYREIL